MIYLSGAAPKESRAWLGMMQSPDIGNRIPADTWWAFDNACFNHAGAFDWPKFERVLRRHLAAAGDRCLFVVAPDVPFDADGTIARFEEYRERMAGLGVPVAFVTQDGMGVEDVPWGDIDALFVGGSTVWKTGQESAALVAAAKARGKWVHMGRVNSLKRLRAAMSMGCDSVDGTFLKYGPTVNMARLESWFAAVRQQPGMRLA
jgi:hypothetical protein